MNLAGRCLHRVAAGEGAVAAGITVGGAERLARPGNQNQVALMKLPRPCTLHGMDPCRCWQQCQGSRAGPAGRRQGSVQETGEGRGMTLVPTRGQQTGVACPLCDQG